MVPQRMSNAIPSRFGLTGHILILVYAVLLINVGFDLYDGIEQPAAAEAELTESARNLTRATAFDMERIIEAARQLLITLSKSESVRESNLDRCNALFRGLAHDLPMYDYISSGDLDGVIRCSSRNLPLESVSGDRWQADSAITSRDFVVGYYGRSKISGKEVIRLSYPLVAADGSVSGVISAGISLGWLSASVARWQLPSDAVVDVADQHGILIVRHPASEKIGRAIPVGLQPTVDAAEEGIFTGKDLDGIIRVFGYVPVRLGPVGGLLVAVGLDRDVAIAAIDRAMFRNMAFDLGVLLSAALLAWIYVRRFIGRPIKHLLIAATRWQAGDWTARATASGGVAEFDRLSTAFDAMAEGVASREMSLQRAADSLRSSQEHLAQAQRIAAIGSWQVDFRTGVVDWSDEVCRIVGVSRETFQPTPQAIEQMILEEDLPRLKEAVALTHRGEKTPPIEYRARRADGAIRHLYREAEPLFDDGGVVIGMIGIIRDITEMREGENKLRRSQEHLARAQRVAAIGSFEFDLATGQIEWSDETYRIFGVSKEIGPLNFAVLNEMIVPEDREILKQTVSRMQEGLPLPPEEFRIRRPDGTIRTLHSELDAIRDGLGNVVKLIGVNRDVTELRETERQRDSFERQLQQAQKMEAIGTLAGGIAHDLNNALLPVIALSTLLLGHAEQGSRERGNLEIIHAAGQRARELVRQILTFARTSEPERGRLDPATFAESVLRLLRSTLPATITIEERIEAGPLICADETQLNQVLMNLVTNAAQAIGDHKGKISVEIAPVGVSPLGNGKPAIRISVIDTGCGMDDGTQRRIFEPFFTTKGVGEGTGLGLSVVHGIVVSHGGAISVDSEPGHGTRFDVYLPIADGLSGTPRTAATEAPCTSSAGSSFVTATGT
jgi:PAS domain S-box-containing protein